MIKVGKYKAGLVSLIAMLWKASMLNRAHLRLVGRMYKMQADGVR